MMAKEFFKMLTSDSGAQYLVVLDLTDISANVWFMPEDCGVVCEAFCFDEQGSDELMVFFNSVDADRIESMLSFRGWREFECYSNTVFARGFSDDELGNLLAHYCADTDSSDPQCGIKLYIVPPDLGVCSVDLTGPDSSELRQKMLFKVLPGLKADAVVEMFKSSPVAGFIGRAQGQAS